MNDAVKLSQFGKDGKGVVGTRRRLTHNKQPPAIQGPSIHDGVGGGFYFLNGGIALAMLFRVWISMNVLVWRAASLSLPGFASDYINYCRTADGDYEIQDEVLMRTGADASSGRQIDYQTLKTTLIKHETGYCISNQAPGQKFEYESKSTVIIITFRDDGRRIENKAFCEFAADGLPAAYTCDKQVVTSSVNEGQAATTAEATASTAASILWNHNGSLMRLIADGVTRTMVYEEPRDGMAKAGARQGSVVFEGTRTGNSYSGTAYIFAKGCKPRGYQVSGEIAEGERRITLHGLAPRLTSTCKLMGTKEDTLVFDLQGE